MLYDIVLNFELEETLKRDRFSRLFLNISENFQFTFWVNKGF